MRHRGEGAVSIVGDMSGAQHLFEITLVVVVTGGAAADSLHSHLAGEGGAALINPHVLFGLAGHQIAKPGMPQLMGDGRLCRFTHRGDEALVEGDVVHMLHRSFLGGDISNAFPTVGAEAAFKHRHHRIQFGKSPPHTGLRAVAVAEGQRIVAIS